MSLGALAVPLLIASTAIGVVGTIVQTSAAVNAANYQASVAQRQAQIAAENAERAEQTAQVQQQYQDMQTTAALGALLAKQSASGLAVSGGSQILTRKSAAQLGRIDALNVRQAGDISAYNYRTQSESSQDAANFAHQQAGTSLLAGFLNAGSTLIGGATNYLKLSPTGLTGSKVYSTTQVPSPVMF